jgi:hypothetical protein
MKNGMQMVDLWHKYIIPLLIVMSFSVTEEDMKIVTWVCCLVGAIE